MGATLGVFHQIRDAGVPKLFRGVVFLKWYSALLFLILNNRRSNLSFNCSNLSSEFFIFVFNLIVSSRFYVFSCNSVTNSA